MHLCHYLGHLATQDIHRSYGSGIYAVDLAPGLLIEYITKLNIEEEGNRELIMENKRNQMDEY